MNRFLTELAGLYEKSKEGGKGRSVTLTMKRSDLKPRTKKGKKKAKAENKDKEDDSFSCLVRASDGKKKISTVVSVKDHVYFLSACNTICKAHMDALKRKERSKRKGKKK